MGIAIDTFDRLQILENHFINEINDRSIYLLGDILVSQEEIDEIAELLHYVLSIDHQSTIRDKYPLTTSVFLVWCSVYDYKEGSFWEPIFSKLHIRFNYKLAEFLGEVFLQMLERFGLQKLSKVEGAKKYMTPILMHGYISEYYSAKLLDYLNAIYTSYLKCDVSDQAMDSLWTEVFNLDADNSLIKEDIEILGKKEKKLIYQIKELSVPANLFDINKFALTEQEDNINDLKKQIRTTELKLSVLNQKINKYRLVETNLERYQAASDRINIISEKAYNSLIKENLIGIKNETEIVVTSIINHLLKQKDTILNNSISLRSKYDIEMGKIKTIKTDILTLGKGQEDDGWDILNDFQEHRSELKKVQDELTKKRKLYQMEEQIDNISVKQVLTASLTHLEMENLPLFQFFITSTLRMIDNLSQRVALADTQHRMFQTAQKWINALHKEKHNLIKKDAKTNQFKSQEQTGSLKTRHNIRLTQPKLRQPSIGYDSESRSLCVLIPEQEFIMPKNFKMLPSFDLIYPDKTDIITLASINEGNKLITQMRKVDITRDDILQISFRWLNMSEYWPICMEPVMVFNEKKQLMTGSHLPNGFYYILALKNWHTDFEKVIDSYVGCTENYIVYEVYISECDIKFQTDFEGSIKEIKISFSNYAGINLRGIENIPGVFMDDMPVCQAKSPILTIAHETMDIQHMKFSLVYQEELFLSLPFTNVLERYGKIVSTNVSELDLVEMLGQKDPPNIEKVQIAITDNDSKVVFERSFCKVQGLNFIFKASAINIKIPNGARLRNSATKIDGTYYQIPIADQNSTDVEIYFNRIGWKRFQIETPFVEYFLIDNEGKKLESPFRCLCSEAEKLEQISVCLHTSSGLPEKIILFDDTESLKSTFHLTAGETSVQLKSFYDVLQNEDKNNKIFFYWEGNSRISKKYLISEIFEKVEILESSVYQTERETDNLFEISFVLNFPYANQIMFRVYEADEPSIIISSELITSNPFYYYLNKNATMAKNIIFEIYYIEKIDSIFGAEVKEIILWKHMEKRILKKAVIKEILQHGINLKSFSYEQKQYQLPEYYSIDHIVMESRHFEEEELFKGIFRGNKQATEVYFYIEPESNRLPFLIDTDYDGVQYHPVTKELFWECRTDPEIMAPLDNLEYQVKKGDS